MTSTHKANKLPLYSKHWEKFINRKTIFFFFVQLHADVDSWSFYNGKNIKEGCGLNGLCSNDRPGTRTSMEIGKGNLEVVIVVVQHITKWSRYGNNLGRLLRSK